MDDTMDDEYVAELLTREARESSQRYQTTGSYMSRRPAGNAPKANTRFLRHLIKETDSHNTALKRKEEREARDRLRHLRARPQDDPSSEHSRSTRRDDHRSSSPGLARSHREERRDRQQRDECEVPLPQRRHRGRDSSTERDRSRRHRHRDDSRDRSSRDHRDRERRDRDQRDHRDKPSRSERHEPSRKHHSHRETSRSRSRSRSPRRARSSGRHRSHKHRRSEPPSDKRSSHSRRTRTEHRSGHSQSEKPHIPRDSLSHSTRTAANPREQPRESPSAATAHTNLRRDNSGYDSDPLEDFVGPLPPQSHDEGAGPIRSRGRGAYKPRASNIDAHFAPNYDPTEDLPSDDDRASSLDKPSRRPVAGLMTADDDWDMALEALRDRQRWKAKGEERLRAAGMNEETIDRWKNNAAFTGADSSEGNPEHVRWAKKGEGREWDRGKVIDEDGHVDVRAAW